ncbi:MAG TPA: aminoacyl-tRNA hydrolase, partial [Rikenellaceae bacterium]|nr:aminoacyl-tRNA hydrolase [Rikenellaceae bacterium]
IGNNFQKGGQVNFVIGSMTDEEKAAMPEICKSVISGIKDFVTIGPDRAMNIFNTVKK